MRFRQRVGLPLKQHDCCQTCPKKICSVNPTLFLPCSSPNSLLLRLYELVHKRHCPPVKHGCNLEQPLVFKALQAGQLVHQSRLKRSMYAIQNNPSFEGSMSPSRVHQSTSQTPSTRGRSMYAIQNNSLFLGLYESVDKCTSPLVEHLPRMDNSCMQSRTTPCFQGSTSWLTSAPVHQSNTCHAWTIHDSGGWRMVDQ